MKVQIGEKEYKVWWKHQIHRTNKSSGVTYCTLSSGEGPGRYTTAICAKGDIFCKQKGRKISLQRAIEGFSKEERGLFWKIYDEQIGLDKSKKQLQHIEI